MPELPEVEVLVRHLAPLLQGRRVRAVDVRRAKITAPTPPEALSRTLVGTSFESVTRRGKFLLFTFRAAAKRKEPTVAVLGHLGMTGRMYLLPKRAPLPKHTAVALDLGGDHFVFEDTRYFGRFTLDRTPLDRIGPEPLSPHFQPEDLARGLRRSSQPIKTKLLDQTVVAGVGNIYASEALFRAGILPRRHARRLSAADVTRLWTAIREVLAEAIAFGSTVPLNFGRAGRDRLFYYGQPPGTESYYDEKLRVYDRAGKPCTNCGKLVRRIVQVGRSSYYCPGCQR